ncbi:hypothetical protein, partial [Aeromonas hydrophila]|uniref:hypothetical protein n=1 Tax=Aeromonas hydrophila TaxID=644 RepID=UPI002B490BBF
DQGVHVGRNGCSTSPEYAPTSPDILPRQLTPEEIETLRQDMRCRHIDNMKAVETMDLSHLGKVRTSP